MPVVQTETATHRGKEGRMFTVGVKVLKAKPSSFFDVFGTETDPAERAEAKAIPQAAASVNSVRLNEFQVVSSELKYADDRVAKEEWEVKVFRPFDE